MKIIMKNVSLGLTIGAVLLFLFAIAGVGVAQGSSGKIEVWIWPGVADAYKSLIPKFNKEYPNIKVNLKVMGQQQVRTKLLAALITGIGAPDASGQVDTYVEGYIGPGKSWDLTEKMKPYADDFIGHKLESVTVDGRIYGVPWDGSPAALYYRFDLLQQYGFSADDLVTWDNFLDVGKKIKAASNGKVGMIIMNRNDKNVWYLRIFQSLLGTGFFDAKGRVIVDNEENLRAFQMMKKLWDAEIAWKDVSWDGQWSYMQRDRLVAVPHAVWMGLPIRINVPESAGKWRVAKMPAFETGGNRSATLSGSAFLIPEKAKNKELAWLFLEFTQTRVESQLQQYREGDLFPSLLSALETPFFDEPVDFFGGQKAYQVFADIERNAKNYYYTKDYPEAMSLANFEIASMLQGEKTPEQAAKDLAKQLRRKTGRP